MSEQSSSGGRPIWPYVVAGVLIAVVVGGFLLVRGLIEYGRPAPEFPLLADAPDPSLHGTVAYFAAAANDKSPNGAGCVRLVSASGAQSRDVLCITGAEFETGPQIAWLPDGRLEVTMFRWPTDQLLTVGWQKIVDVSTLVAEDTPLDQVPATITPGGTATSPAGEVITAEAGGGHAEIVLTGPDGLERTLMEATVSTEYQLRAIWSPTWDWVLAYDGRLLVVTIGDPAVTRVLAADVGGIGGYNSTGTPVDLFAVTALDLLDG